MQDLTPDPATLEPIELADREVLAAVQLERMRWSLQHAYDNVPHYRAAFDAAGVGPADLRELADLRHFPFTTKADLRAGYPFGMFAVPRREVARMVKAAANSSTTCAVHSRSRERSSCCARLSSTR